MKEHPVKLVVVSPLRRMMDDASVIVVSEEMLIDVRAISPLSAENTAVFVPPLTLKEM